MSDETTVERGSPAGLFVTLLRRWRIVAVTVIVLILAVLPYALLRPDRYVARTVLVPAQERGDSRTQLLASALGGEVGRSLIGGAGGPSSTQRLVATILRSQSMTDSIMSRMVPEGGVGEAGEAARRTQREVARVLRDGTHVEQNMDGSVVVTVTDADPERAAAIANAMPEILNGISVRITAETAVRRQQLLAAQVDEARLRLIDSEQRLADFQLQRNLPEPQEQARRTIEAAAELQSAIHAQEIVVSTMSRTMTPENPQLRVEVNRLADLRTQLRRLAAGRSGSGEVLVPIGESPTLRLDATRLEREYRANEQIYLAMTAGFLEAQMAVGSEMPVVSVLDPAVPPRQPYRPWKPLVMLAAMFGLVGGVALAFLREAYVRGRESGSPLLRAWDGFCADVRGLLPGRSARTSTERPGSRA
jgi:tyrosine-protein kinase Etk/Wzc